MMTAYVTPLIFGKIMKPSNERIEQEILKIFSLINDLDSPEDILYDILDMLAKFEGSSGDWKETPQYNDWINDPDKVVESWRNCMSYVISILERASSGNR